MMSRFWGRSRDNISPYASQTDTQGVPHVTEDDFSYITSEDLENTLPSSSRAYEPQSRRAPPPANLDDDVLLIKNKGVTYPVHFPAYSIGDGKLLVRDVRVRVGLVMDLSDRRTHRMKMLYKGRQLTEQDVPIRDYGVKNNSELLVVVPEGKLSDEDDESSSEEVIVTEDQQKPKKAKKNKGRKKKRDRIDPPRKVSSPAVPSGPKDKLDAIRSHFDAQLMPGCQQFLDNPPKDGKKLHDEHRRISETIMQHVLLKLDEVDTGGDPDVRAMRRELVKYVQDVLKDIDERLPLSSRPKDR
ncbi:putative bag domain-containing protein [Daldinia childiae]|uniref:putative bag domain-containing protein n=1 Tax=Daldinia childiae TaxID=326645 RepID=UPI001445117E|nr:putative bag domain-containing protein [Daldinia childiae]KAF3065375.1 putative bag domain-containing protein [Daldinia childiae]